VSLHTSYTLPIEYLFPIVTLNDLKGQHDSVMYELILKNVGLTPLDVMNNSCKKS